MMPSVKKFSVMKYLLNYMTVIWSNQKVASYFFAHFYKRHFGIRILNLIVKSHEFPLFKEYKKKIKSFGHLTIFSPK